jgi:large repetitive protein
VTNTATAHAGGTNSNPSSQTVTAVTGPALSLVKTASPLTYSAVGAVIGYSYHVTNTGNVSLAGPVTVTDNKATVTSDNKATVTCPAGGLAVGASMTCTATYTITQADLNSGSVTNTATAHANGTDSNQDHQTVTAIQGPALSIVKTASPLTYSAVGAVISYSYLVKNTGNVTLAGPVTVTDNKATVTCPAGGLAVGASMTCTATYTITQADLNSGSVTNTATAHANGTDSNQDHRTVTATPTQLIEAATSAPSATPPATSTGGAPGGSSSGSPLFALLVALVFCGFALLGIDARSRAHRR